MDAMTPSDHQRRGLFERPDTPAQTYAAIVGAFLIAIGVLGLVLEDVSFGTVGPVASQPEFLIWSVSGWTTLFWIAMGAFGVLAAVRLDTARSYALFAGVLFAVVAVWGFIDGNDVVGLLTADTTNNVTHAVLGGLGLIVGSLPRSTQRASEMTGDGPSPRRTTAPRPMAGRH
jgi:amino acid transporter